MLLYGLFTEQSRAVVEVYLTSEEAEAALQDVLHDEPEWVDDVSVVEIELGTEEDFEG